MKRKTIIARLPNGMTATLEMKAVNEIIRAKGLDKAGDVQQFHTANVLRRIKRYMPFVTGATYKITEGYLTLADNGMSRFMSGAAAPAGLETLKFEFATNRLTLTSNREVLTVATDGTRSENVVDGMPSIALCSGAWISENQFELCVRWVETCSERSYVFSFDGDEMSLEMPPAGPFGGEPMLVKAQKQ